jgi:hypothetical protein
MMLGRNSKISYMIATVLVIASLASIGTLLSNNASAAFIVQRYDFTDITASTQKTIQEGL